jgi:hypothetical protein
MPDEGSNHAGQRFVLVPGGGVGFPAVIDSTQVTDFYGFEISYKRRNGRFVVHGLDTWV